MSSYAQARGNKNDVIVYRYYTTASFVGKEKIKTDSSLHLILGKI